MSYSFKKLCFVAVSLIALIFFSLYRSSSSLPIIAIANYGPHPSLQNTIDGIKDELARLGLHENENIKFETIDVNFEPTLIMQMLAKLKASQPKVLVALTTPVAQAAKNHIKDIPIIFSDITDPVAAGLLTENKQALANISGASDKQDLVAFLHFAKQILPQAKRIGILYATGEINDIALVNMMKEAAKSFQMEVVSVPVDQARDIPLNMQAFRGKVDFIYVGGSGPIQPSLPAIVDNANKMHLPVFNADSTAVKNHLVLGSFGVSYYQVGVNTANLIYQLLQGEPLTSLTPIYPKISDHQGYISKRNAEKLSIDLPTTLNNTTIVE